MEFPLLSKALIADLKLVHGLFNLTAMLLFFYHARNGFLIRRARTRGTPLPFQAMKRHRRMGAPLALIGGAGFSAGLALTWLNTGNLLQYPPHLFVGAAIVLLLVMSYNVARKIAGASMSERDLHYRLGIAILACYIVNVVIGIGVFL